MTATTPEMSATPPQPVADSTGEGDGPLAVAPPVAPFATACPVCGLPIVDHDGPQRKACHDVASGFRR